MIDRVRLESVTRIHRRRAETIRAVDDVSVTFRSGNVAALVGPSGSGKTTLLNLVIGWDRPDEGHVWRHEDVDRTWQGLSVVPQGLGLVPDLTIGENIELPIALGNPRRYRSEDLIDHLGLGDLVGRRPAEVSLGEQQRTAVARAVVCQPAVLIADEPTAHQDEHNSDRILAVLLAAGAAGAAVVLATHETRLLDRVDEIMELTEGRLRRRGPDPSAADRDDRGRREPDGGRTPE